MSLSRRAFDLLADPYNPKSLGYRARARRMSTLLERFPEFREMHVLDLGGNTRMWQAAGTRPAHVTLVDIGDWAMETPEPWMTLVKGDACRRGTIPGTFDLVFSNSLIEHVGGPRYRRDMAEVVHSAAPHHWVQTPYRYFPLEPHFVFPGFQFLPLRAQMAVFKHWGPVRPIWERTAADERVQTVVDHDLLTTTEMRSLFPSSEIIRERAAGLTKSLIAVR